MFRGFIIATSVAMLGGAYGTFTSDTTLVLASVISGLVAAAVGWLGFIRDLRRDAKAGQSDAR